MFKNWFLPSFDWIQVEVSGLCNAKCLYCPHTVWQKNWLGTNLSLDLFKSFLPYLKKTRLVYLQGWGEPLLNPNFFEMVRLAKSQGAMVGFTTNGTLIDDNLAEKLILSGVDIIAFSLAGIETNDRLRKGTSLTRVLNAIEKINAAKKILKQEKPQVHIAYMLLKSNEHELEKLPNFLTGLGIKEIVVSLLDLVPDEELQKECLVPQTEDEFKVLKSRAEKVAEEAKSLGLRMVFNLPSPSFQREVCSENPIKTLFINSLGMVSPCVFTGIPAAYKKNLYFGNIKDESLKTIWNKKEYQKFRNTHPSSSKPSVCITCPKTRTIEIPFNF
ncbi:radical SAM protein [Thermodesulfobacterium sp. TA1]|uniref:radical SAM protein n=1 Tax=Thermodesulfobacterium sp. TA1 TaxID=2234087 RepID=UPI001231AA83|nr:radical SAM protein [Thermodesulfobacterium sp. TA1]QER42697.1 radical SAM protein [Thermodesulfobacterium sp. TA1]